MAATQAIVKESETPSDISKNLAEMVAKISKESIEKNGTFTVALSGGSLPALLAPDLVNGPLSKEIDWSKWQVFFSDERHLPTSNDENNYNLCNKHIFSKVPIPESQIYIANTSLSLEKCAEDYENKLKEVFGGLPEFDLLLNGMGPDGHTCSLFPGHRLLDEKHKWVDYINDSPKPPPERITFTYTVLNNARNVIFVVSGASKKEILAQVFQKGSKLPSSLVKPKGNLYWLIDKAANELAKL
eukprot:TRINITY_DN2605_c0_g1_i1.p1 TRINITY_DN2605_c0_g1~~TRINITY_DN2605_c0_g1_i1.p1  ORF type:complete len:258 (+),score=75.20 TRINITY_DN2605_c0_g1_i1:47-775(+)